MLLIIKGTEADAQRQLKERGIPWRSCRGLAEDGLTHVTTGSAMRGQVIEWFCEPTGDPYPAGTLLFYSETRGYGS